MKPQYPSKCEICKRFTPIVFDGRIRLSRFGPKGHWMFLCPICHFVWGLGYGHNELIIYGSIAGNYFEIKRGSVKMNQKELREAVKEVAEEESSDNGWKIVLLGEVAIQLAGINEKLEALVGYMASVETHLQPKVTELLPENKNVDEDDN